jgi:Tfp pilus assembly protein PilZ
MIRLTLPLAEKTDWLRAFDPRGGGVFVPTEKPPSVGSEVRVDLTITEGGPRVILKGNVVSRRDHDEGEDPAGCHVGLLPDEREKVNFINGYVRGGLINRRERRRLPLRLPVTYGAIEGPKSTFTRDINEEGLFILTDKPLPERTLVHFVLTLPERNAWSLKGLVTHTVIVEDEDVPGMGVRYAIEGPEQTELLKAIDKLEEAFFKGALPEEVIT